MNNDPLSENGRVLNFYLSFDFSYQELDGKFKFESSKKFALWYVPVNGIFYEFILT